MNFILQFPPMKSEIKKNMNPVQSSTTYGADSVWTCDFYFFSHGTKGKGPEGSARPILRSSGAQEGAAEFPQHFEVQSQPVQLYRCTGVAEAACLGVKGAEVMQLWGGAHQNKYFSLCWYIYWSTHCNYTDLFHVGTPPVQETLLWGNWILC